jgi:hypothetical protein
MDKLKLWWNNDLPKGVKFVFLVLLANAVPAIIILMSIPHMTEDFFVWTVKPVINARLMGVMYANALILISIGIAQTNWARVRIIMVVITLFSVLATVLTFFYLKPFLAHPWFHITYWLGMYLVLFFAAPYVFVTQEKKQGGRLPIQFPLSTAARVLAGIFVFLSFVCAMGLLFRVETVNLILPWTLPPLVGGLIGVLFITHTAAYTWALWDGDWLRVRPMFWQAPLTALLFILLPILHPYDLRPDTGSALTLYYVMAGLVVLSSLGIILSYRAVDKQLPSDEQ